MCVYGCYAHSPVSIRKSCLVGKANNLVKLLCPYLALFGLRRILINSTLTLVSLVTRTGNSFYIIKKGSLVSI